MSTIVNRLNTAQSIPELFFTRVKEASESIVYSSLVESSTGSSRWQNTTIREAESEVRRVASLLATCGVKKGDRVAIISQTRPEWMIADMAVLLLGGVSVSVYPTLTAREIGYILYDSGTQVVFIENEEQFQKIELLLKEKIAIPAVEDRAAQEVSLNLRALISFEEIVQSIERSSHSAALKHYHYSASATVADLSSLFTPLKRDDLANIVYTSGTTGPPKGVVQTHGNHLANVRQALEAEIVKPGMSLFLLLPLAHSFAKLMGYIGFIGEGIVLLPAIRDRRSSRPDLQAVARDLAASSAQVVPVVPRILEKMKETLERRAMSSRLLALTLSTALVCNERRANVLQHLIQLLLSPLRAKIRKRLFGSGFEYGVSGGAKLAPAVNHFFAALGIEILEGYGLTETCVATNVNRQGRNRIGTVGPVLAPDIELKLEADGEITFRGPNITTGYWNRPEATRAAWDSEGWFHTGDLGALDSEGNLSIVGRKKEILVTAGGKKIPPEPIENELKRHQLIAQVVLVGDAKPYCCALIFLSTQLLQDKYGIAPSSAVNEHIEIRKALASHVAAVNSTLASFETVKRFYLLASECTIENGLLTPTMKVKRSEVYKRYHEEIERLYRESGGE